ncbi:uncharacterized protein LOC143195545 [Rhynchophorus ferrugineus]|uniref:uncharacterized protein LOC143195545 n=1 Tax=Rhynchophorus ferrugineus TaxID=354439 RepID=UPI003FCD39CB
MINLSHLYLLFMAVYLGNGITTVHHDKPESVTIGVAASTTKEFVSSATEVATAYNVTLSPIERHKRLLPYENFYFNQPFNRPHLAGVSAQQYRDFQYVDSKGKKRPLKTENTSHRPKDVIYQQRPKFTPFLESNALPGPFIPMIKSQNGVQQYQYVVVNQNPLQDEQKYPIEEEKAIPDFSSIYDKLAQLKLRQQTLQNKAPYGYRLMPYQRPIKEQNFQPIRYEHTPKLKIEPSKTTYETFTATSIDIPSPNGGGKYQYDPQRYQQPSPSNGGETKSFIHQQIAIDVPRDSIPLVFNPNIVKKPPTRTRPVKPYIVLQQEKPYSKQPVFVLRKPKPIPVIDETYTAQKLIPITPQKHQQSFLRRPVYVQQNLPPPPPSYETTYEHHYQATPSPVEQSVSNYENHSPTPSYAQVEYGNRITPRPHPVEFVPVISSPKPQYQGLGYYSYDGLEAISEKNASPQYESVSVETTKAVTPTPDISVDNDDNSQNLANILRKLQESNALPQTLTPDNIDNSIKTLVKILNVLRQKQKEHKPIVVPDYQTEINNEASVDLYDSTAGGTPGKPGIDYPALSSIPTTSFNCKTQRYKGFFADTDTNCQVWHYCDLNGGQASFLCPNGTIFSQVALTCDWWYNVKCSATPQLYVLNERLYKYIIPLSPKFPEDYTGPLVDKYLALKFQEMEEKLRKQKKGKGNKDKTDEESTEKTEGDEEEETENSSIEPAEEESTLDNNTK